MQSIKKKLHSQSGVSFLFALLAFMVAAMVSVTIVTAALTSIKRVYNDREDQQQHLTLTSAAQLVRDEMLATTYEKKEIISVSGPAKPTTTVTVSGVFSSEMKKAIEYVNNFGQSSGTVGDYTSTSDTAFTVAVTGVTDPVTVNFTMKSEGEEKYNVVFTFTLKDSGETLFLKMNRKIVNTSGSESNTTTKTTTIKWENPIINGLEE